MTDAVTVPRAGFSIADPWAIPRGCPRIALVRSSDGSAPRLATEVAAYHGDGHLTVVFSGADDHVVATHLGHDDPLYEEDVFEVFLAPATKREYFELEVSPMASTFDARVESPDGVRSTMKVDRAWTCEGLFAATRRSLANGERTFDAVLRIPFASLGGGTPAPGETWRGNFFRIDRHPSKGDEFLSWRPTGRNPADFHVTAAFGELRFGQ